MPVAKIATTQAKFALEKLHAELGDKIFDNKRQAKRLCGFNGKAHGHSGSPASAMCGAHSGPGFGT